MKNNSVNHLERFLSCTGIVPRPRQRLQHKNQVPLHWKRSDLLLARGTRSVRANPKSTSCMVKVFPRSSWRQKKIKNQRSSSREEPSNWSGALCPSVGVKNYIGGWAIIMTGRASRQQSPASRTVDSRVAWRPRRTSVRKRQKFKNDNKKWW